MHAAPFAYCGSIGPICSCRMNENAQIHEIGNCLANAFRTAGSCSTLTSSMMARASSHWRSTHGTQPRSKFWNATCHLYGSMLGDTGCSGECLTNLWGSDHLRSTSLTPVASTAATPHCHCHEGGIQPVPSSQPTASSFSSPTASITFRLIGTGDGSEKVSPTCRHPGTIIQPGHPICTVFASGTSAKSANGCCSNTRTRCTESL